MKSIQELRQINEAYQDQAIPFILILKRKSLRQFPNGETVAMYYNDRLKQSFTIPFKISGTQGIHTGIATFGMKESVLDSSEKLDDVESNVDSLTEPNKDKPTTIKIRKRK